MAGAVSNLVRRRLVELLTEKRIVVWYDEEQTFPDFLSSFHSEGSTVVSASESILQARRRADAFYREMNEPDRAGARANLLLYLPFPRGKTPEERQADPFEHFCCPGAVFGVAPDQKLESLARQAMPEKEEEIQRLFSTGKPSLALLDGLQETARYPLLREALGTESPIEIASRVLCEKAAAEQLAKTKGADVEFLRLAEAEFGFVFARKTSPPAVKEFAVFALLSEFVFDSGVKPESLSAIPTAAPEFKEPLFRVCERMRSDAGLKDGYIEIARGIEEEFQLPKNTEGVNLGVRDTFPFEERRYLLRLREAAQRGELKQARSVIDGRRNSVWKDLEERKILWSGAERCIDFLETAAGFAGTVAGAATVKGFLDLYTAPKGLAEIDRLQRFVEAGSATGLDDSEVHPLVQICRDRYQALISKLQERFFAAVEAEGWPVEGYLRQTQVFDRFVAPFLEVRRKTAYFLVDSLRFEMGGDLAAALSEAGDVEIVPALTVIPPATRFGMAALMPRADGDFRVRRHGDDLFPSIGTRLLKESADRMNYLREEYGQRFSETTLDEILSKPVDSFRRRFKDVDFLAVRTQDPDQIAENLGGRLARKYISDAVSDVASAVRRLSNLGFTRFVVTADHGHVLLPEIPAGDTVSRPAGDWQVSKRRCLLGSSRSAGPGSVVFKADRLGVRGEVEEVCIPKGFKVFSACDGYFHEGLSLQECVIPVVTLHVEVPPAGKDEREVMLSYGKDSFTSRVIGIKVRYQALLADPIRVVVQAYGEHGGQIRQVGEAADCPERDEKTHEIRLEPGRDVTVPVLVDAEFDGPKIEIRVADPTTGVIWAKLALKNEMIL